MRGRSAAVANHPRTLRAVRGVAALAAYAERGIRLLYDERFRKRKVAAQICWIARRTNFSPLKGKGTKGERFG
jgi:hypothetical protein